MHKPHRTALMKPCNHGGPDLPPDTMMNTSRTTFETFASQLPDAVAALRTLNHVSGQSLDKGLAELVKVRVSQINGCAYCLQFHLNMARKSGVTQAKLDRVAVWREAPGFEQAELAALAWAEAVTLPALHGTREQARQTLDETFSAEQVLHLTVVVATINAWNRIAGPLGFEPPASA